VKTPATCYACDQPATTREHVPPQSFFPKGHRNDLMTVPSCELHNNAHSKDVEYTRNVLSTYLGTNTVGQQHFNDKAVRSFDHSPKLLFQTFGKIRLVGQQGMEVGIYPFAEERVTNVMKSCARALYFLRTGERKIDWELLFPSLSFRSGTPTAIIQQYSKAISTFRQLPYVEQQTASPDVFEYAIADLVGGCVYALRFYRSFVVYGATAVEAVPVSEG
jgi:hypothetical protein